MPPMVLVTARAIAVDRPCPASRRSAGSRRSSRWPGPAWPLIAPLATLILPPCLTQVTELRSRPARSLPSTLTSVLPPVLTCVPPAAVAEAGRALVVRAAHQHSCGGGQSDHTRDNSIHRSFPSFVRRPDGVRRDAKSRSAGSLPIPNFVGRRQVRFAGDAVIHGRGTTGAAGAAAFPGWVGGFDRRRGDGPRRRCMPPTRPRRICRCGRGCPASPSPIWTPSSTSAARWSSISRCAAHCGRCGPRTCR